MRYGSKQRRSGERNRLDLPSATQALNDNYLVDRFSAENGSDVRYCAESERWFIWDSRRWRHDRERQIEQLVRRSIDRVAEELEAGAQRTSDPKLARSYRARAKTIQSPKMVKTALQGVIGSGSDQAGNRLSVAREAFDAPEGTAHLLNCANGVLNTRTFELLQHAGSKSLLITQLCSVSYRLEAPCPLWEGALERIFECDIDRGRGASLIELLQVALGYALTGEQDHHIVALLYGPAGRNGKSLIFKVVLEVMGSDYACSVAPKLLNRKRGEAHPTGLADLRGRRFAGCMEFAEDAHFDAPLLKQLSGGDQLKARRMHEDFWSFEPTHHLWLGSNYVPAADAGDTALWRRFRIIPFNRQFLSPGDEGYEAAQSECHADPRLAARILEEEREGVLAWLVEGLRKLRALGSVPAPAAVHNALQSFLRQADPVHAWMEERCDTSCGAEAFTAFERLYSDLGKWCAAHGEELPTRKGLGQRFDRLGLGCAKRKERRGRLGIQLLAGRKS